MSIKFITDSASDMCEKDGVTVVPMTITFGNDEYKDGVTLSHREFYEKLIESDELPRTSQVSPYDFETSIGEAVADGSEVIVVTMASGLSGTYQSAVMAADKFDGVYVVDSESVTIGEIILIKYGMQLAKDGCSAAEIVEKLNECKKKIHIIALLDTLEYLKKGGRISKTVAFAGGLLSIKPDVTLQDGAVQVIGKARGSRQGINLLVEHIEKAGGIDFDMPIMLGYTGLGDELLKKYIEDSRSLWEGHVPSLEYRTIGGTIGTHVGPGVIAVAFYA